MSEANRVKEDFAQFGGAGPKRVLVADDDMDVCSLLERVRGGAHAAAVPILMISGHGSLGVGERARAAGVDAFLDKPFTLAQLRATIGTLLLPHVRFA